MGFIFELQKKVLVIKPLEYEKREVWWEWPRRRSLRSVLVVLKRSLWMRERKVGHRSEFTIFAFNYILDVYLNKGDGRAGRVTVKWMQ